MSSTTQTINPLEPALYFEFEHLSHKVEKKPIVLFFGRKTFSDNTKYLYLACVRANPNFQVMWCTWDKNLYDTLKQFDLPCLLLNQDLKTSTTLLLDAAAAVFCENPYVALQGLPMFRGCLAGAKKIQLWHGVSVKQLDLMLIQHLSVLDKLFRNNIVAASDIDYLASTSSNLDGFWYKSFGTKNLLRIGQARNEVILRAPNSLEYLGSIFSADQEEIFSKAAPKILVCPTWQRHRQHWLATDACYDELEKIGHETGCYFFVKLHPFMLNIGQDSSKTKIYERVVFLDAGFDVYPWMRHFSALVTDYSSIMFDFILTGKPALTLNIPVEKKLNFEPDYSLIPNIKYAYEFEPISFKETLINALEKHPLADTQNQMCQALFETDPLQTCSQLIGFLETITAECVNPSINIHQL